MSLHFTLILVFMHPSLFVAFATPYGLARSHQCALFMETSSESDVVTNQDVACPLYRRKFIKSVAAAVATANSSLLSSLKPVVAETDSASSSLPFLTSQIKEARDQLDAVPRLIQSEKWDSVRAILITPPLSNCWAKTGKPLLQRYAEALGDVEGGDELAALELKEDVSSHLRFLDMAVYNNVFNPIKTEGTSGATKELVRSYYEDPTMEFKASISALEGLIDLATEVSSDT